jgi:hypothetical protein
MLEILFKDEEFNIVLIPSPYLKDDDKNSLAYLRLKMVTEKAMGVDINNN